MSFPPIPKYPNALDSNFTLFKVFNTSESPLAQDNNAYADLIEIVAQNRRMWAENGYINLSGELIYYDGVDRDSQGRIFRFKRCLRGINGFSQFNAAGTMVRGMVVAEQHNQLALATILTEQFIGINFDPNQITLDWRIRNLAAQPPLADDYSCPEVEFDFQTVSTSPSTGTTISYSVTINGAFGSAIINFGDGSTTTTLSGTHTYAVNAKIDPVVTVTNNNCQVVQTPIERDEVSQPTPATPTPPFTVPVPITPAFPSLIFPSLSCLSTDLMSPPIIDSCLDLSPFNNLSNLSFTFPDFSGISLFIPSLDLNLNLSIDTGGGTFVFSAEFPSEICVIVPSGIPVSFTSTPTIDFGPLPSGLPSVISFGAAPSIPSTITFVNNPVIPSQISIGYAPGMSLPSTISIVPPDSFPPVNFGTPPTISVNWGTPPSITCSCVIMCPGASAAAAPMMNGMRSINGMDFEPLANDIAVEYDLAGLPTVISILPPDKPMRIEHDVPTVIRLEMPNLSDIRIHGPENPLPSEIRILAPIMPELQMTLVAPQFMELRVPEKAAIPVVFPDQMPMLSFDRSTFPEFIRVTGFPESIKVEHNIPTRIEVDWSEAARTFSLPPVEVKPIEVKVDFNYAGLIQKISSEHQMQCFALIPCNNG